MNDDLDRLLRATRPRPGWSAGTRGRAVLADVGERLATAPALDHDEARRGRGLRPLLVVAACAVAVAGVALAGLLRPDGLSPTPAAGAEVVLIQQSYRYDVGRLEVVLDHNDTVFAGRVEEDLGRDTDEGWTYFRVRTVARIAGDPAATVRVRQRGYVDDAGVSHLTEDQPLLREGEVYLLAANHEPSADAYTLGPGPYAAKPAKGSVGALVAEYRAAGSAGSRGR